MRARPVAVIAVSLLLIAGATGFQARGQILHLLGADRPITESAPHAVGSTLWACPDVVWIKAYQSIMVYYPPYHPAPPPLAVRPTRCYRTASEARSAGFKLAPPPTGGAVLNGVYFVPAGAQTKTTCQAAATQLGIVIPCPTLLPNGADNLCSPISFCMLPPLGVDARSAYGFTFQFTLTTPPDYPGAQAVGFALGRVLLGMAAFLSSSPSAQQIKKLCSTPGKAGPTVMERPTLWRTCSTQPEGGAILTWEIENATYVIASSGDAAAARRMVQFFASKLLPVLPAGG
jgi:hypothetical protein